MTRDDLPRLFAVLRLCGELGEAHGQLLWDLTRDWSRGVSAASLESRVSSSNVPDPTGNLPIDDDTHRELVRRLNSLSNDAGWVRDLLTNLVTDERPQNPDELWCSNHLRVSIHEPRYRGDLCQRCYRISGEYKGLLPGPRLMAHWRDHARTSAELVEDFMRQEHEHADTITRVGKTISRARHNQNRKAS